MISPSELESGALLLIRPVDDLPDPLAHQMAGQIVMFVQINQSGHVIVKADKHRKKLAFRAIDLQVIE